VVSSIGIDVMASLVTGTRGTGVGSVTAAGNVGFVASKGRESSQDGKRQNAKNFHFQGVVIGDAPRFFRISRIFRVTPEAETGETSVCFRSSAVR
jgi:hypothetical protein